MFMSARNSGRIMCFCQNAVGCGAHSQLSAEFCAVIIFTHQEEPTNKLNTDIHIKL